MIRINSTLLPLLQTEIYKRGNYRELQAFQNLYDLIPTSGTRKTKYLTHRFFGDTRKGLVFRKANMEQGAYQLHRDFCTQFEASCEGCPFIKRYQTTFR